MFTLDADNDVSGSLAANGFSLSCVEARFRFAGFELDMRARELRKDGMRFRLQEQPFIACTRCSSSLAKSSHVRSFTGASGPRARMWIGSTASMRPSNAFVRPSVTPPRRLVSSRRSRDADTALLRRWRSAVRSGGATRDGGHWHGYECLCSANIASGRLSQFLS
jgi:hypothetical protein